MSDRASGIEETADRGYPKDYLKAEFNATSPMLPYGPAWPGGFSVGAGALLLFFGGFLALMILIFSAGPFGLLAGAAVVALTLAGLGFLMRSGLGRYTGSSSVPPESERDRLSRR